MDETVHQNGEKSIAIYITLPCYKDSLSLFVILQIRFTNIKNGNVITGFKCRLYFKKCLG